MASNEYVRALPPTKAEALNTLILGADPPVVVPGLGHLTVTEDGSVWEGRPTPAAGLNIDRIADIEGIDPIDLGILDWDDPDLVIPPWAQGLTPEDRTLVGMVPNQERERYAKTLRAANAERERNERRHSKEPDFIGLAPPELRASNALDVVQDLPGATPTNPSEAKQRPKPRYVDRSKSTSTYEGTGEPKPEGPAPKIEFAVLSDDEIQRVRPAAHVIRHMDRSKGYRLERFPFPKDLFNRRR